MTTYKRICIEDWSIQDTKGQRLDVKRGEEYITSPEHEDGTVTVFSTYWVPTPKRIWAGERLFTK